MEHTLGQLQFHRRFLTALRTRLAGMVFPGTVSIDAAPTGLKGLGQTHFYTDTVATRLKRVLKSSRFPRRIRFGFKPNLPDLGVKRLFFLKLTLMVRLGNRTYRAWRSKIGRKNREL